MAEAELAMRFPVSADKLWSALTGPCMLQVMLDSYAASVDVEGENFGAGAVLVTTLRSGGVVREKIESIDGADRCMKYRVLDAGPLPYAQYRGEARIQSGGPEASVASFRCNFVPVELSEAQAKPYWLDHNRRVMDTLRRVIAATVSQEPR